MRIRLPAFALGFTFALAGAHDARGAQITDRLAFLHVDGEIGYEGSFQFGSLREGSQEVGRYNAQRHQMNVDLEFGVAPGTELYVRFPIVFRDSLAWKSASEMSFSPDTGLATMVGGAEIVGDDLASREGSGFGDMWIGVQGTPFSEAPEKRWNAQPASATLLLELGVKLPTARSRYEWSSEAENHGVGSGGTDLLVGAAFSKRIGTLEPYLATSLLVTGKDEMDLQDSEGTVVTPSAEIDPADRLDVSLGTEVLVLESRETRRRVSVDIGGGWSWHGAGRQPAGTLLPTQLAATEGYTSVESAYMSARLGFGLYFQPVPVMQMRLGLQVVYPFAHVLERVDELNYGMETGFDSIQLKFGLVGAARF